MVYNCVHRYWTEGLAVALLTHLPIMIGGAWLLRASSWWKGVPFMLGVWLLFFHSLLSHKEHRYIFPVVPLASVYAGKRGLAMQWTRDELQAEFL